jgi:probable F420-dependent oxidoreductase
VQFGITFPNTIGTTAETATAVAQAAERGGFATLWTVEHVVVPSGYQSPYPYDESGKMNRGAEAFDMPDPLIWLTWAAAVTTTIELATGILIATQRNPLITAKEVASLDRLSGGRVRLGVGVGWLREEFDALGVPWAQRGKRLDEYVEAMRTLWTGDKVSYHGEFVDFTDCYSLPRPHSGSVPIVIGGHTEAAARRAGRLGDAFFPGNAEPDEITALIEVMKRAADEAGRDGEAIDVYAMAIARPGPKLDARIEALGQVGAKQAIIPTFAPDQLEAIGADLATRFG